MMQGTLASWGLRVALASALAVGLPTPALAAAPSPVPAAAASNPAPYVLRYGDALSLTVLENEKLRVEKQPLRPDGRLNFPLVGEVMAGGLTVAQLQARLTQLYARYYTDPHVVLNVVQFRPMRIAVVGHLRQSRTLEVYDAVHLLDALAQAGSYDDRADLNRVLVVRASGQVEEINVNRVLEGEQGGNVLLHDGDTVRVLEQAGPDWGKVLPPLVSIVAVLANVTIVFLTRVR